MAVRSAAARRAHVLGRGPARDRERGDGDATTRVLFGYAKGAANACYLSAELRRRAQKLAEAPPKLRERSQGRAAGAARPGFARHPTPIAGLSERGTRRLFERLATLSAIRELTGRGTLRLYGLYRWRERKNCGELDRELEDLPPAARWREWMGRVEAVVFASAQPVLRENLAEVVGKACNLDLIFDEIKDKLRGRPYEIVAAAGGWSFRTKLGFDAAIRLRSAAHRRAN